MLLPSILTLPATAKQLFLLKPFHLPFKAVSKPHTPGSPRLGPLSLVNPGQWRAPPAPGPRNKGQIQSRKSNLQCMEKSVPVGARGHRTKWKVSQYMMRGWKAAAPRVR